MYQLRRSKRDVQRAFHEPSEYKTPMKEADIIQEKEPDTVPEWKEPVKKPIEKPVIQEEEPPVLEEAEEPPVMEAEKPPVIQEEQEPPVIEEEQEPPVMEEEKPPVMEEEKPPVMEEEKPPVIQEEKPPVMEEEESPVMEEEESPVMEEEKEESPVMEEEEPPVMEEEEEKEQEPDDFQPIEESPKEEPTPPEEPMEEIPITTYDYDGDSYFVDNRAFLQRTFDFPDGSYPVSLCIYTCVRNGCCPYLLYLTVYDKTKNALVFPTAETVDIVSEDTEDNIRERTMESFQTALFSLFPPNESKDEGPEGSEGPTHVYNPHLFQGLFLNENNVYMVYDSTRVSVPLATDKEYYWATPYEITSLYHYRNVPIDPSVTDFFQTISTSSGFIDKSFHHLKRLSDGSLVPSPYVVFPCSLASPGIFTFFGSKGYENPVQLSEEDVHLLIPTIDHPSIGNVPLFSSRPLDPSVPHIQRYVAFVDVGGLEPFFVEEDAPEFVDHLYDLHQTKQYSSLNFIEKGVEYWSIKSPLYFTEIHDRPLQTVPIHTFQEIDAPNVPKAAPLPKDFDTLSNEGSDEGSDEGDELSDEGSDMEGSNEGSDTDASNEESDEEDLDDFHRGYQEGLLVGMKQKAVAAG